MNSDLSSTVEENQTAARNHALNRFSKGRKADFTAEEYVNISESSEFNALVKKKSGFIVPVAILFLALYILLPIFTSFTSILDGKAFGDITWVWIYSLGLFIMTWFLCMTYVRKAASFDENAQQIIDKAKDGGYE
ncbi:DUF485 domain-containing protein [Rummeliibacillus suwonensis]|uniref:DUF485 domain-containing protein n=1 Tax=Rummeliibacillus suwonensis TaxID=1306154 RepID=UPI00289D435C|nr:DUF485 domain-containing protein [Rummeliibacillus suwonensis]